MANIIPKPIHLPMLPTIGGNSAHLTLFTDHSGSAYLGVLSVMDWESLQHTLVGVGNIYPETLAETRRYLELAALKYPGEVIVFECSSYTLYQFTT